MRVVVVFCEGPHDLHFAARSVMRHGGYSAFSGSASDLPTPFGWKPRDVQDPQVGLVLSQLRRIDTIQASLDRLNFGKKPLFEYAIHSADKRTWLLFVNSGGDSAATEVKELIKRIRASRMVPGIELTALAFAFLFDADFLSDNKGKAWRLQAFQTDYEDTLHLERGAAEGWKHANDEWVGLWIHYKQSTSDGTLEELLEPLFTPWSEMSGALAFIDTYAEKGNPVREKADKRRKAAFTIAGQLRRGTDRSFLVGSAMNVMIQKGLEDSAFDAEVCREVAKFLTEVPW
jgi:hypothetical protein